MLTGLSAWDVTATQAARHFRLTILHNNDGESQLIDSGKKLRDFGGVARFATLVHQLKHQALTGAGTVTRGVIMLSSGDNFLAGPIFKASLTRGVPFFDSLALNLIGYDAIAIGNHEFDFGPDVFADFITGTASTPFVSANLTFHDEPRLQALVKAGRIVRSTIVETNGERLGIVGATTPQLPYVSSPRQVAVDDHVAAAVQAEVRALTAQGINKIILISHLQGIDTDLALVPQLRGVDVVISGGGNELLAPADARLLPGDTAQRPYPLMATDADGTSLPVVTTRGGYRYVGRLIVEFDAAGAMVAIDRASGPVRVAGGEHEDAVAPHPRVQAQVTEPVQQAVKALASHVIGRTDVDLDGRRRSVRTQETNEGNLIADAVLAQATRLAARFGLPKPSIALHNGDGIRNDAVIAPGALTELDTFGMLPFPNFVTIVPHVPATQVKAILENAVSRVERTDGRFAQIAGFHLCWTPTGTPQQLDKQGNVVTRRNARTGDDTGRWHTDHSSRARRGRRTSPHDGDDQFPGPWWRSVSLPWGAVHLAWRLCPASPGTLYYPGSPRPGDSRHLPSRWRGTDSDRVYRATVLATCRLHPVKKSYQLSAIS